MNKKLHFELGASDMSAAFLQDAAEMLQLSPKRAAKATFGRTAIAFMWRGQRYIHLGVDSREEPVSALELEDMSA